MQRDLTGLADTAVDVVVVGAGIYGALAAWEAARRGLAVALIDRGDFGGATSFNSLKTLHGGLRSLQSLNLAQMRLFIRERRAMARMAPHLVDPLPFCVPTYRHPTRNAVALRVALAITDAVGHDRNDGVDDDELRLPGGRVVSAAECLRLNPLVDAAGVTGGAVWHDYQMRQAERITVSAVRSAADAGARVANDVEALALTMRDGRVAGLDVRDRRTGTSFHIATRAVLNAAGPWAGALASTLTGGRSTAPALQLSRAMNLVVPRCTGTHACGGVVEGRYLFIVPWRDVSIVGTSHDPHDGDADAPHGTAAHAAALLRDAQTAFPRAGLTAGAVRLVHRGLLPMVSASGSSVALLKESAVADHARDGHPGLVSIFSVRYTTARHTAAAAVAQVSHYLGHTAPPAAAPARMTSAAFGSVRDLVADARRRDLDGTTADTRERLARAYGSHWTEVAALIAADQGVAAPLSAACPVTRAEVLHAARHECGASLGDVLLRRTGAGAAGHPGPEAVAAAADVLAQELGWDTARVARDTAAFNAVYPAV
ncbi:MAG: FAD-dependent oxidoreductase [Acidobacteria bacterium]|nr:FAD-dependent oxidoreductase [Acidobacteriota bacterium]